MEISVVWKFMQSLWPRKKEELHLTPRTLGVLPSRRLTRAECVCLGISDAAQIQLFLSATAMFQNVTILGFLPHNSHCIFWTNVLVYVSSVYLAKPVSDLYLSLRWYDTLVLEDQQSMLRDVLLDFQDDFFADWGCQVNTWTGCLQDMNKFQRRELFSRVNNTCGSMSFYFFSQN